MHDIDRTWIGLNSSARYALETRDYSAADPARRLATTGLPCGEILARRDELEPAWIPGVEIFPRRVFQQKGRGYFSELTRLTEGTLERIGLQPAQWASALMHRDSAKGFHIHPPFIPEETRAADHFRSLYLDPQADPKKRPYDSEQWDVMFFLTSLCEMILVDERAGMPRKVMRFILAGDSHPGPDNAAVVIPAGVAHALRNIGHLDLIMVYGTSTVFNPTWEGRLHSSIENAPLPPDWSAYLESPPA